MDFLIQIGWFGGWVLGIIGFFLAHSAWSELRHLRATPAPQHVRPLTPTATHTEAASLTPSEVVPIEASTPVASNPEVPQSVPPSAPHDTPSTPPRDLEALLTTRFDVWVG
jgi:hypothetical protein